MGLKMHSGVVSLPVRSFRDARGEAARRQLRSVFGPAASDQNAPFSSILPSGSGTTPAERKGLDVTQENVQMVGCEG